MINPKDISIIVQGKINKAEIKKCLKSIRKHLKGAEIILSTWEGSDLSGLDYDVLVESKDPGATIFTTDGNQSYNNLNRQLLSTQEGLKKANREYILKLRSDLILTNNSFLNYFDKYQERCDEYKLFERKIIIPTLYSRKFVIKYKTQEALYMPFHPSDFFLFGLNEDIKKYFMDTKLVEEPAYSNYFKGNPELDDKRIYKNAWFQYPPEQYFAISCFNRHFPDIKMKDYSDINFRNVRQSEIAMVNNFIVLEYAQHGIYMNKYKFSKKESQVGFYDASGLYFQSMYLVDYKKHCDPSLKIPFKYWYQELLGIEEFVHRLNKHVLRLYDPEEPMIARIEQLISIPYSSIKIASSAIRNIPKLIKKIVTI